MKAWNDRAAACDRVVASNGPGGPAKPLMTQTLVTAADQVGRMCHVARQPPGRRHAFLVPIAGVQRGEQAQQLAMAAPRPHRIVRAARQHQADRFVECQ